MLRQDGSRVWMTCRLLPLAAGGKHAELLFAAWEVGERPLPPSGDEAADPLTGLPTRAQLLRELQELTRPAPGRAGGFALLHLDLDGFQKVNDALGHAAGDRLLVEAASRLSSLLRTSDRVARFGSDEFAMILSGTHEREAVHQVARKILTAMSRPYHLGDRHLHLTASIGIALYPEHASDGGQLLKHADIALTSAKAGGRNRCLFYRSGGVEEASRQVSLEEHMYEAIQNGEFEMHYQPICRPDTRELVSVEALMRWHRPGEGFVPPAEFIPLAERNGLIGFLGAWSLRASCHQVARWNATWGVGMGASVNLSPVQFHQGDIVDMVRKALDESGLPPHLLTLEITEGALMQDPAETEALLNRLRALGVGISVDDFGTGYSSLAYLKRFPLSSFKIDRSFIAELDGDGNDLAIVSVLIDLARVLDLSVVAEGVETEAQLHMLADKGCRLIQGYLLGRPVSAQDLTDKVESGEWKVGQ
jgi:diguanylate cyclase (GGDEF)-like protein